MANDELGGVRGAHPNLQGLQGLKIWGNLRNLRMQSPFLGSVVQDLEVKQQRALKEQIVVVADHEEAVALVAREAFEVVDVEAFGGVQRDERFHRDGFGGGGVGGGGRLLVGDGAPAGG